MKLTIILLVGVLAEVSAVETYAQSTRIDLSMDNARVKQVLKAIESKSEFVFFYNDRAINMERTVNIHVENRLIEEILSEILPECTWRIDNRKIILIPRAVASPQNALANPEDKPVKGTVKDEKGEPIAGASVIEKGTSNGTITDVNGNFSLSVSDNATLVISFVGYKSQEISNIADMGGKLLIVNMIEDALALEEIVVVGYGSVKKSDLTGSVASIPAKAFADQPASSINSVLSGRAAGVVVRNTSGGGGTMIRIRGANSIYGGNDPLIVVDGNYGGLPNPNDIESIEILKDASATAIYGSRGANGVILVTTKRGTSDTRPTMNVYSDLTFNNMRKLYDKMDAGEFAEFNSNAGSYPFTAEDIAYFKANGGTDWEKEVYRTGLNQNHKLVFSGGTKNIRYRISPFLGSNSGMVRKNGSQTYSIAGKLDMDLSNRLTVQIETNIGRSEGQGSSFPLVYRDAPVDPIYNEDGSFHLIGVKKVGNSNPVASIEYNTSESYSTNGSAVGNLKFKILEGLVLDAKGYMIYGTGGNRSFTDQIWTGLQASAAQSSYDNKNWLFNTILTYSKTFADVHSLTAMIGFEETKNVSEGFSSTARELPIGSAMWYNLALATPNIEVGSWYSNGAMRSFFGRLNYSYKSKYLLTMNYRADGSSRFKAGNKFSYFPSFSAAYRLTEEGFMKDQNVFQNVKLRGGWGITGNQAVSAYATFSTLMAHGWDWGQAPQVGYMGMIGGNPNLKWETTKQLNLGVDLTTFDGRLEFIFDFYHKKTTDLLAPVNVPAYNGGDSEWGRASVISNVGSVMNRGFEATVNVDVVQTKQFSYDFGLTGAINRNRVLDIGDETRLYGTIYNNSHTSTSAFVIMPDYPIGTIYGMKYLGIWQESEAAEAAKYNQTPGDYKYEDLNNNGAYDVDDNQVVGDGTPKFTWGLNNHLSYKDFDLNILLEGMHDRDVLNWTYMYMNEPIGADALYYLRARFDTWSPENPNAEFAKIGNTNRLVLLSDHYMQDASYVRLRNISLSYRIPRNVISFANIKLAVSAQNILTLTKYKGVDPEIGAGDDINSGIDYFSNPNPKSFSLSLSLEY
ncbi:MAG: TonB-dependent receptor [Tannerella sp.]|nr:TonB-dependent receptor [Tannerella sp.]